MSSSRQHEPNPSAPSVQKLRIRYAKRGKLRFMSHRDVARAVERALRRAGVPMAYSQGFSPRPKVSWIGAAPTGTASEAEYLELSVVTRLRPESLVKALNEALPTGLDVLDAVVAKAGGLAERVSASQWRITLPGVSTEELRVAVGHLLAATSAPVQRMTKSGLRTVDVRPPLVSAQVEEVPDRQGSEPGQPCGILEVVVRQTTPAVRPDDVLSALRVVAALTPPVPAKATRMAQGWLDDDGRLVDPFVPDRDTVSATAN